MTVNGHTEIAMATNETFYAGARAAAEAGMNRAIEAITSDTTTNLLAGQDGAVNPAGGANAGVNADNGSIAFILTGASPYALGTTGQYTYTIQIRDDDDPSLYPTLSAAQIVAMVPAMGEDGSVYTNANGRLILQATGWGPQGTRVTVSRVLGSTATTNLNGTTTATLYRPALLVYGDLTIAAGFNDPNAWFGIDSDDVTIPGNVHANGNLDLSGRNLEVSGDLTASGTLKVTTPTPNWHAGGQQGGGMPTANTFDIDANTYKNEATHILQADGRMLIVGGAVNNCPCNGWSFAANKWTFSGTGAVVGRTYFVQGDALISGGGTYKTPMVMSVIALGSIETSGNPYLYPANSKQLMLVANGDVKIHGTPQNGASTLEGRILAREQLKITGYPHVHGQIIVQNAPSVFAGVTKNEILGSPWITHKGTWEIGATTAGSSSTTTYVHIVSGWMESQ